MGNRSIEKILLATGIVFSVSSFAHCDLPFFMRAHAKTNHQSSSALQSAFNTKITNEWSDLGWPTDSQDSQLFSTVFDNSGNLFAVLLMRASTSSGFAPSSIVEYTNNTWTTISANYLPTTGDGEPLTVFVSNNKVYALFVKTLGNAPFYAPYQLSIYQYSGKGTSWTKILNSSITTEATW